MRTLSTHRNRIRRNTVRLRARQHVDCDTLLSEPANRGRAVVHRVADIAAFSVTVSARPSVVRMFEVDRVVASRVGSRRRDDVVPATGHASGKE